MPKIYNLFKIFIIGHNINNITAFNKYTHTISMEWNAKIQPYMKIKRIFSQPLKLTSNWPLRLQFRKNTSKHMLLPCNAEISMPLRSTKIRYQISHC